MEKFKREGAEMERALLKVQGLLQSQVIEKVLKCNLEERRVLSEEEVAEMVKAVNSSQQNINQLLLTRN